MVKIMENPIKMDDLGVPVRFIPKPSAMWLVAVTKKRGLWDDDTIAMLFFFGNAKQFWHLGDVWPNFDLWDLKKWRPKTDCGIP